MPLVR